MPDQIDGYISDKKTKKMIIDALSRLVAVRSVANPGEGGYAFGRECAKALDTALEIGRELGFRTENHGYYCGSIVMEGSDSSAGEIGIVTHLDVVPAVEGWSFPPFKLTEKDGLLIGRGVHDDKGPAVAALAAMTYFKTAGKTLPFSVRLLMGCDEELGMEDLPHFLEKNSAPRFSFTPDSEFPVCNGEKGIASVNIRLIPAGGDILSFAGGTVSNAVADRAELTLSPAYQRLLKEKLPEGVTAKKVSGGIRLTSVGKSAHAAMPEHSVNAIRLISAFLTGNRILKDPGADAMMRFLTDSMADNYGAGLNISASDASTGKLTCICGKVFEDNGAITANYNIRYPVSCDIDELFLRIVNRAAEYGFTASIESHSKGYFFSPDKPEIRALTDAYSEVTGLDAAPYVMGGGTYARAFPNTVAFGAALPGENDLLGPGRGGAHQRDEYWKYEHLETSVKVFIKALENLAKL